MSAADSEKNKRNARLWLGMACLSWSVGFPIFKAMTFRAQALAPGISTWFVAGSVLAVRFLVAALILFAVEPLRPNRRELEQAALLGVTTGVGIVLQQDGMAYTAASTSAFLTQGFILFLPLAALFMERKLPPGNVILSLILVLAGLTILSRFDFANLSLGRGETETLLAAFCFTFQILVLDSPRYTGNRTGPVTQGMFVVIALVSLPVGLLTLRDAHDLHAVFGTWPSLACVASMIVFPTIAAFWLMNRYQRTVSVSEAGIIYGMEPVCASAFALFLPELLSTFAGVSYPSESLGARLLLGGALVVAANLLRSLFEPKTQQVARADAGP